MSVVSRPLFISLVLLLAGCGPPALAPAEPTLPPPALSTQPRPHTQSTGVQSNDPTPTEAAPPAASPQPRQNDSSGTSPGANPFVKMEMPVTGSFRYEAAANTIHFSQDFNVEPGPDLFVILSGADDLSLDYLSFSSAVSSAPILYLGTLANTSGVQAYAIPPGTDLSRFNTIVVWCKSFSVAFAAAPLR